MFRTGIACLALLLSACAPFHKPMSPETRSKVDEVDLRVVVAQEGFMISAQAPGVAGAAGGGLIPALIDSAVQQSRQNSMAGEIRATTVPLIEHDFRAQAARAVAELQASGNFAFKLRSAKVLAGLPTAEHNASVAATAKGPAYLVVLVQYSLEPGLGAFTTRSTAMLWQGGQSEPAYRSSAIFQAPTVGASRAEVVKWLAADQGKVITGLMHDSVAETLQMVSADIASPAAAANAQARAKQVNRFNHNGRWLEVQGAAVNKNGSRVVLQDQDGALFSLTGAKQ